MDCYICQDCICVELELDHMKFSQNLLIKSWYPEKANVCNHSFCQKCLHGWLVSCLNEGYDFTCPVCRLSIFQQIVCVMLTISTSALKKDENKLVIYDL